ncbi:S10 family peptidase [Liberibacter crescens]|uniref:S10 family peptidase n=1 Tax=Liberibacter crescens TaxID=1273132 RepID=UPI00059FAC53|nr:hypothetical protein [Liberibacter crescens]AMC13392.1 hypothetical protein RL73_05270 [Liberibacter crescens]
MKRILIVLCIVFLWLKIPVLANDQKEKELTPVHVTSNRNVNITEGSVVIGKKNINYQAETGMLELYIDDGADPVTRIFYIAYFKKNESEKRPITFVYGGGPGSSSTHLHIGGLGPKRVVPPSPQTTKLPPYQMINNEYSLLDSSDLVFIDAPGTGYGNFFSTSNVKIEREKENRDSAINVYGSHGDSHAFSQFIIQFLTDHQRWNSPKYLLGESYGTVRSVLLAEDLGINGVGVNGIILISPVMNYYTNIDTSLLSPGIDYPYYLTLPTYAAIAWYHNMLPGKHEDQKIFLSNVEQFALGPYAKALQKGINLSKNDKKNIAAQLYQFTGISTDDWIKADLRLNDEEFSKKLLNDRDEVIGRLDARFSGSSMDKVPLQGHHDPSSSAIYYAYAAQINNYLEKTLKFYFKQNYKLASSDPFSSWRWSKKSLNVLPTLAFIMKEVPAMKVMVISGIYDLATPYFTAKYDMDHLPISPKLHENISFYLYDTGHAPYLDEPSLKKMYVDMTEFIVSTHVS